MFVNSKFSTCKLGSVLRLVAAGVVLRGNEDQSAGFRRALPQLRCAAAGLQDANDCEVSRQDADSHRSGYREAKNQRHEERNQDRPTLSRVTCRIAAAGGVS